MSKKVMPIGVFFAFLLLFYLPGNARNAIPQQSDTTIIDTMVYEMEEVVVTATRYEKKIIDIPYPVVRFDNVDFQYARKVGVSDVLTSVPGLLLQSRYGNHDVRISIRGFGSQSNSGIRGVRILLDGIPESEPDGQTRIEAIDFNSVGRIEIVKGNLSSLYTNAPGGVVNFLNDIYFPRSFVVSFNDFGSFNLRRNGFKAGIRTKDYAFLLTYSYHNYKGYRAHSEDYWHIVNSVLDIPLTSRSNLQLLGYYVSGLIRLPGSLTKEEFEEDPFQAAEREEKLDFRRVSQKGRFGIRYSTFFDTAKNNELQFTLYGTIKQFDRPGNKYKIITRYGIGGRFRFLNRSVIFGRKNEFSFGGDLLHQTGPVESYDNFGGAKGDILSSLLNSIVANRGFFIQNSLNLMEDKLDLLFTGRYEEIAVKTEDRLQAVRSDEVRYDEFTPKIGLIYKFTPSLALYGSYGRSFNVPAKNELENPPSFDINDPYLGKLLNHRLRPSKTKNMEAGIKYRQRRDRDDFFSHLKMEITAFNYRIEDEIVPFEILSEVFYRNSAVTNRRGLEIGADLRIYKGLNINLAYTLSDYRYDRYIARSIELDSTGNFVFRDRDFTGNIVPSIPRHNLFLAASYEHALSPHLTAFGKISHWYTSGLYVDDRNSDITDGFRLLNTAWGIHFKMTPIDILLSFGIDNILDKTYVAFTNTNSADQRFYEAGAPRNFFGSVKLGYLF